jgi:hypothetical protein
MSNNAPRAGRKLCHNHQITEFSKVITMSGTIKFSSLFALLALGACTTMPSGPSVHAMPGTGKSFDQFRNDDILCRQYALQQGDGMTPDQAAVDSGVRSAAVGTLVGAAAGAAINGQHGAGVGAGVGLLFGALSGAAAANRAGHASQRDYDVGYTQCMYAQGHRVPTYGRRYSERPSAGGPSGFYPPPPPRN